MKLWRKARCKINTFGLDYEPTLTVISLREGRGPVARLRCVGDGQRQVVPNAALNEEMWGSRAWLAGHRAQIHSDIADALWLEESGPRLFWRGLYRRLYTYLGRLEPVYKNGYRLVAGIPSRHFEADTARLIGLCREVGLEDIACIFPPDAVLCRWLAEGSPLEASYQVVVVVVVGDTSAVVRAYRVKTADGQPPQILAAGQPDYITGVGRALWVKNVATLIADRLGATLPPEAELAVQDAALELGAQLTHLPDEHGLSWRGPLHHKLIHPLQLTRRTCLSWPEAILLNVKLLPAIQHTLTSLGAGNKPDLVIWGGIGALWPCGFDVLLRVVSPERIWRSASPQEDVSRGAAWWPEFGERYAEVFRETSVSRAEDFKANLPELAEPPRPAVDNHSEIDGQDLPPWERDTPFDF